MKPERKKSGDQLAYCRECGNNVDGRMIPMQWQGSGRDERKDTNQRGLHEWMDGYLGAESDDCYTCTMYNQGQCRRWLVTDTDWLLHYYQKESTITYANNT